MSHQDPNMAPNQNTFIELLVVTGPGTFHWNAQADAYAMSANRLGQTVPQITTDLCRSGYAASQAEVLASLGRQGVHTMQWTAVAVPPTLLWDARADAFTLAAHQIGQPPLQVLAELRRAGYGATVEQVGASLYRQGVRRL